MAQYIFGAGTLWATPLMDAYGNTITNGTPIQIATSQEVSMDESFDTKSLYGQNQFPVDSGRGKGKLGVKCKFAQVNGLAISSLYFGQSMTSGLSTYYNDLTGQTIPATPYTITVAPSSGTWSADMGVRDSNGLPMTKVATGPTTGQYSVSAGVYTFAAADTGKQVFISYAYTQTSTQAPGSTSMQIVNVPMGAAPQVQLDVFFKKNGKSFMTRYPRAIASKLSWQSKLDDYMVPEMDFDCFADAAGNVLYRSLSE